MNRLFRLWHCTVALTTLWVSSAILAAPPPPAASIHLPGQGTAIEVSKLSPAFTSIALRSPDVSVTTHTVGYENVQAFSMEGEVNGPAEGCPSVPMITRFYRIPNTGGADLVIHDSEFDIVNDINPLPFQDDYSSGLERNAEVYGRDEWYPPHVAEMSAPMIMRDFRLVRVTLYPVQVNPVTHQARIYQNLSADVVANDLPGENELTGNHRPSGAWASMYRAYISNLDEHALDDMTTSPGGYMILANPATAAKAESLATWRTRKGFKVVVDTRGNWNSSSMFTAIHNAYLAWNDPPLEFVCLMGDGSYGVPMDGNNSDHNFANMTSGDDIEDLGVGRIYGGSDSQMALALAKIFGYERTPHMESSPGVADTAWFHRACLAACVTNSCASNYTLMEWAASQFRQNTGINNPTAIALGSCPGSSEIIPYLTAGTSIFAWRGTMMQDVGDVGNSSNPNGRLPISVTITCGSSSSARNLFTSGTVSTPKGCVSAMGTDGTGTHNPENVTVAGGFLYNVASLGVEHIGNVSAGAKAQLFLSDQYNALGFTQWNNLLGDPGMSIWTDVPKLFSVTYPSMLTVGARCVDVMVRRAGDDLPITDATVCLWKRNPDSTWVVGQTDAQGMIQLPVAVNATGTMMLTVTKRNFKPYLADIACANSDCMPMASHYTLDDDNTGGTSGNSDGVMNPGETIDLNVHIRNFGTLTAATSVNVVMTSNDPRVTVVNSTATYPTILPGDSALGSQAFRIQVDPALPHGQIVPLILDISSTAGHVTGRIDLRCVSGDLQYLRHRFVNGSFGPGLTRNLSVTIKNTGANAVTGVTGHLQSLSPFVTISVGEQSYGTIPFGALDSNSTNPFTISANPQAYSGLQASMLLILNGDNGFVDSTQFTVDIGSKAATDPVGPDTYGYYAYDNTDVNYALHPAYNYINLSTNSTANLHLNDTGEKTMVSEVWSTTKVLPFHFTFYGRTYDTLTICSNGWVAFGNQGWNDNFRNYPIPGMQAPDAMIAPYWDDLVTSGSNLGVWAASDPDSGRYVIQWKATATGSTTPLDFEVILYDSAARPSMDGNGYILLQYNQVAMGLPNSQDNEPSGCTIGIQDRGGRGGLQYAFITSYSPGAATMTTGRAVLFTTDATMITGNLAGYVRDAGTNQPIAGAIVRTSRYGRADTTDAAGHYQMDNVLIGTYDIYASKYRFNSDSAIAVTIQEDNTTTLDFTLHHPEMQMSANAVVDSAVDLPVQVNLDIINHGNGPLDYSTKLFYAGDDNPDPWDSVSAVNISQLTDDSQILGCEFLFNQWWVTGANGPGGQNVLYRFDADGNYVGFIPQPSATAMGWFDLATDGRYLYGSDGPGIIKIDTAGNVYDTIPSPVNPTRALAYDPLTDHFWVADDITDIYELDRAGIIQQRIANRGDTALAITGLAWRASDPDGYTLYAFSRDDHNRARVTPINPLTHQIHASITLESRLGDNAAGCTITQDWNSALVVFAAVLRNPSGCRLGIYEMNFDQSWISLSPASASVPGGMSQSIIVRMNPANLHNNVYHVNARISSAVYDTTFVLPITLTVRHTPVSARPRSSLIPTEFAVYQNYPNPFNPNTQIRFDLPEAEHVQLKIFNTLGQQVATLVDEMRPAGSYTLMWNGQSATGGALASGLYIYQIKAGNYIGTRKMLLMK